MPLNKAIDLLKCEYHDFICYLKEAHIHATSAAKPDEKRGDEAENESEENNNTGDSQCLDGKKKELLDLTLRRFAEKEQVRIPDLDFLLSFLNAQKRELIADAYGWTDECFHLVLNNRISR